MDQYNFGREKEALVAAELRRLGYTGVGLTERSKGSYDVYAKNGSGRWMLVQVKASRISVGNPTATGEDKQRLLNSAIQHAAEAWIAYVVGNQIEWESVRA